MADAIEFTGDEPDLDDEDMQILRSMSLIPNQWEQFAEGPAPLSDQVAIAGRDGQRSTELLSAAKRRGFDLLANLVERAVNRLLATPDPLASPVLFTDAELAELTGALASQIATADLLGRARVRRLAEQAQQQATPFAEVNDDPFAVFAEPIPPQPPAAAIGYFQRLVPDLAGDPQRYGPLLDRHAFTLAHATDQVMLDKVKQAIAAELAGQIGESTPDVQAILDAVGVSPRSPQYAEMVVRTNVMDAYNQGVAAELADPAMQEIFPVWRYEGIRDGRQGEDHEPRFDRYYPSSATFHEVRGPRVFNCRCGSTPISKYEWADLLRRGERVETRW